MNELFVPIDEEEMLSVLSDYLDDNDKVYPLSCKGCEKVINIIIDLASYENEGLRIADIQEEYSGKRGNDGHLKSLDTHLRHLLSDGFIGDPEGKEDLFIGFVNVFKLWDYLLTTFPDFIELNKNYKCPYCGSSVYMITSESTTDENGSIIVDQTEQIEICIGKGHFYKRLIQEIKRY